MKFIDSIAGLFRREKHTCEFAFDDVNLEVHRIDGSVNVERAVRGQCQCGRVTYRHENR